jgi:centromere/kinetochore protein ZW10
MADDVRELLLSTTADADPSTPLSAPDLRLLIDRLRLRSDRLHASALSFASSDREPLASALLRAAGSAASSASLQSALESALSQLSSSPDLSDLRSLSDRLFVARSELRERQEHLAAASSVASLSARLRAARASANPLDAATAAAELKHLILVDPEGFGSGGDEPVVFGLLRGEWEQLVDEVSSLLVRGALTALRNFVFVLIVAPAGSGDGAAASGTCEERRGLCGVCT